MRSIPRSAPILAIAFALLPLAGCAGAADAPRSPALATTVDWRSIATPHDRRRVREWRTAFTAALAAARASGHGEEIAGEGALLVPDAALPDVVPPPGTYACRTIKLGAQSEGLLDYVAYPPFRCLVSVEQGLLSLTKLTGSQRPIGLLFQEGPRRMIFLGTLQLGDERLALQYGRDRERDMAGLFERVGEERWRLVLPYPHFESTLDVLELVPAR